LFYIKTDEEIGHHPQIKISVFIIFPAEAWGLIALKTFAADWRLSSIQESIRPSK